MAKYCKKCGKKLANTAMFCDECGTLAGASPETQSCPQPASLPQSRRRWELVVLGMVITLVGLCVYVS